MHGHTSFISHECDILLSKKVASLFMSLFEESGLTKVKYK